MRDVFFMLLIVFIIITSSIYINIYLDDTTDILVNDLQKLKNNINEENLSKKDLLKESEDICIKWRDINKTWSNIELHNEIDSIETSLIRVKTKIETGNIEESIEDIEISIFLLNHVKEKEKINLKNIF